MNKFTVNLKLLVMAAASLVGCAHSRAQCPLDSNETALDCPWAETTRATRGLTDPTEIRKIIDEKIPGFMAQIESDAKSPDLLNLWGLSRNIDESHLSDGAHTVPENLLRYFQSILQVPYDDTFTVGHAGLTHTYGYLFSTLSTPFGYKRFRYVAGEIESGFGLTAGLLSGTPSEGTLLSNLTRLAAPIAFGDRDAVKNLKLSSVKELDDFNFSTLRIKTLLEEVSNSKFTYVARTDVVPFLYPNTKGKNQALLVHSIDFHTPYGKSRPKLITAFPVEAGFAEGLFNPKTLGEGVVIKLRYNAMLPETIPPEEMIGTRYIHESTNSRN